MQDNSTGALIAKIVFSLVALGVMVFMALYIATWIFMFWWGGDVNQASPLLIFTYYEMYGNQERFDLSFAVSFGVPFLVFSITPLLLILANNEKRSLHGDAKWANNAEIQKMGFLKSEDQTSILVGKHNGRFLHYSGNQFISMIAPTRSGKGVGIVIPNLLHYKESVVVLDIKGENYEITSGWRSNLSYNKQGKCLNDLKPKKGKNTQQEEISYKHQIFKFAPFDISYTANTQENQETREGNFSITHCYNPLDYISDNPALQLADISRIAFMIYPDGIGKNADSFFQAQARALFIGFVLYLIHSTKEEKLYGKKIPLTIGEVLRLAGGRGKNIKHFILYDLLASFDDDLIIKNEKESVEENQEETENKDNKKEEKQITYRTDLPRECIDKLAAFANQSDNTMSSILGTFTNPLDLWLNASVDAATSKSDFRLEDVRKHAMSIYVVIPPDKLAEARVLINLFFSQLLAENLKVLPEKDPELLKHQCLLLLDEFTAAGSISAIQKGIAYIAGYNMRLLIINQNTSQLVENYSKAGADTILGNIDLMVMYAPAPKPESDSQEYSRLLGYQTVKSRSKSRQYNPNHIGRGESESDQKRALMLPQELLQMDDAKEILVKRGQKPIFCNKIIYYKDKLFNGRVSLKKPHVFAIDLSSFINERKEFDLLVTKIEDEREQIRKGKIKECKEKIKTYQSVEKELKKIEFFQDSLKITSDYMDNFIITEANKLKQGTIDSMKLKMRQQGIDVNSIIEDAIEADEIKRMNNLYQSNIETIDEF